MCCDRHAPRTRRGTGNAAFLEDGASAVPAGATGRGDAEVILQSLEIRAPAGGGNRDVAIRDSVADTDNHGCEV
jgi:hypothetical protein